MTPTEIQELLRLADASTPGPWKATGEQTSKYRAEVQAPTKRGLSRCIARCPTHPWATPEVNAAAIASYPEVIAALRQTLEELEAANAKAASLLDAFDNAWNDALETAAESLDVFTYEPYAHPSGRIRALKSKPDTDPTPYCLHCGPKSACTCGPIARNN